MRTTGELERQPAATTDSSPGTSVSIEVTAPPVLSYALAHNRVPVVNRLAISNDGGPVRAATLRLSVRDAEGPIAPATELLVHLDEGRTTVLTASTSPSTRARCSRSRSSDRASWR